MATIDVKDASGATVAIEKPLTPGRAAAASSRPVVLANEDLAAIGATNESAAANPAATAGLNGVLKGLWTDFKSFIGSLTEAAPATDTASSGLNGRLQRVAQNLSTISKAEDAAHSDGDKGVMLLAVRQDTFGTALAGTSGDYIPLITGPNGLLAVGPDGLAVSGSVSSAATLFTQDCIGFESISVHVTSAGTTCTITYEVSNDNSNWVSITGIVSTASGTVAPASTSTTNSLFHFSIRGRYFRARVSTYGSGTVSVVANLSKAPISYVGAVNAVANGNYQVTGPAAHDAVISGAPVRLGARALTANYTAVSSGDVADLVATLVGALIQKPYSIPELDWSYAAASGGITDTSDVPIKAAAAAGLRNYLTVIDIVNAHASVSTEVVIKDGASVIWRSYYKANGTRAQPITFPTPLRSTAATALNVACITTGSAVYVNAQGYVAP